MAVEVKTIVTVKCGSPKCSTVLSWVEQEPETTPDAAFRFLVLQRFTGEKETVCSKACLFAFMENYVPSQSPREVNAEAARQKEQAQLAGTAPLAENADTESLGRKLLQFPGHSNLAHTAPLGATA